MVEIHCQGERIDVALHVNTLAVLRCNWYTALWVLSPLMSKETGVASESLRDSSFIWKKGRCHLFVINPLAFWVAEKVRSNSWNQSMHIEMAIVYNVNVSSILEYLRYAISHCRRPNSISIEIKNEFGSSSSACPLSDSRSSPSHSDPIYFRSKWVRNAYTIRL